MQAHPKLLIALVAACVVGAAAWIGYLNRASTSELLDLKVLTHLDTVRPVPAFSLIDHHGNNVGLDSLRGRWRILFFGFTHCPAVCPTTMNLLDAVVSSEPLSDRNVGVTLISVDPERDTPARLHSYLKNFNTGFAGLTGKADELAALRTALFIPLQRVETEEGYTLDHGSALIVLNPKAEVVGFITPPHRVDEIAADLATLISQ